MWDRSKIEAELINPEWVMFQEVQNEGGRADCQEDWLHFNLFRCAQFLTWSEAMLDAYRQDLLAAQEEKRNLLTEKYAYMMESTDRDAFANIKAYLPEISAPKKATIDAISTIYVRWHEEYAARQPALTGARSIRSSEDSTDNTSYETYLKGELATYSMHTLNLMEEHLQDCLAKGLNLIEENMQQIQKLSLAKGE